MTARLEAFAEGRIPTPEEFVKMWPTPAAHDPKDLAVPPSQVDRNSQMLPVAAVLHGLQEGTETGPDTSPRVDLNPQFVEALMGLPRGWLTPSTSVETASFQQWLRQHSSNYSIGSASDV